RTKRVRSAMNVITPPRDCATGAQSPANLDATAARPLTAPRIPQPSRPIPALLPLQQSAPDPESLRGASVRNTPILLAMALAPVARPLTAPADSAIIAAASGSLGRENRRSRCPLPAIRGNCPFTQDPRGGTSMRFPCAASVLSILTLPLAAQNALQHYDGTTEFTSRGASGTAAKTLLQRIPMDQACGRTAIATLTCTIQDQSAVTPESFTIEVRGTDPAGPPSGAPT